MPIKINLNKFDKKLENVFKEFSEIVGEGFNDQLTDEVRSYPRDTVRRYGMGKTGKYAGKIRDVVDSGELVDSYSLETKKLKSRYQYDANHAAIVYMGWVSKLGKEVPPYPWIEIFFRQIAIVQLFGEVWNLY